MVPVHRGECQVPCLGCQMQVWSEDGKTPSDFVHILDYNSLL